MKQAARTITTILRSHKFFYVVLAFFIFEALWFVFSAMYPMAFDEDFHFGIIKIYSEQWSPFLNGQPPNADEFGALAVDPSYFFHYLMSFPYRVIALFTDSQTIQVILLRIINVVFFAWSLVLFRRVMLRAKASPALAHTALAIFVLIPIVPQLAAHINYDNLLMTLVAAMCLVVFRLVDSFRKRQVDVVALAGFISLCFFTSIVKYAALPLILAATVFVIVMAWRSFRGKGTSLVAALRAGHDRVSDPLKIGFAVLLIIGAILFAQRYVVNVVKYHYPVPDCGKVVSVERCLAYGPWARNYRYAHDKPANFEPSPIKFMGSWLKGMWHRLFFTINGKVPGAWYANYLELPFPSKAAIVITFFGVLATIVWWRQIFHGQAFLVLFLLMILFYVGILWLDQYTQYVETGRAVAINGRYLLLIALPMAVIMGRAFSIGLKKYKLTAYKPWLAAAAIACFVYGGGVFTFILRSDASWYWPNQFIVNMNEAARDVLAPVIVEGKKQ